jgi:hypothetical protein
MSWCVASNAVSDQESSCARETKKGYSSRANKECPFPLNGIIVGGAWTSGTSVGILYLLFPRPRQRVRCGDFCDQLVPLLRWCSQSVLSIYHGWQLGLNTTASSTSRRYWGHHPRFNLVCSTSTCVRPSNRSPTGRAEPESRTVK